MKITCPNCDTKFAIGLKTLGSEGRKLKCSACAHIWRETDDNVAAQNADAHKIPVAEQAAIKETPPLDNDQGAIDDMFDVAADEDNDQGAIDDMFDVAADEDNDQGAIDDMFDVAADEDNDQGAIDDMFDVAANEDNDQGSIDDMFDVAANEDNDQGSIDDMFDVAADEDNDQGSVDDMFNNPLSGAIRANSSDDIDDNVAPKPKSIKVETLKNQPNHAEINKEAFEKALPSQSAVYKKQIFGNERVAVLKWGYLSAAAIVLISLFIFGKDFILNHFPKSGAIYGLYGLDANIVGLDFEKTTASHQSLDGIDYLHVNGSIINNSGSTKVVPKIRGYLVDSANNIIYSWAIKKITKTTLADGEIASFTDVLKNPELSAKRVKFKFVLDKKLADK